MSHSSIYLIVALVSTAIAATGLIFALVPERLVDTQLRGYRQSRRQDAMAKSGMLRALWPLLRLCTFYTQALPIGDELREKKSVALRIAGEPWGLSVEEFYGLQLMGLVLGLGFGGLLGVASGIGFGLAVIGAIMGLLLPEMWLNERGRARLLSITRGLPAALDLIVMSMSAGMDFVGAVRHVVDQWTDKNDALYEEMARFLHELSLGKRRPEALQDMAFRAPTELMKSFVANAIQAEQRGTPLVEVLKIQAEVARTKRFQRAEQSASRAGVAMMLPLLCIFATTILVMFGGLIVQGCHGRLFP